MVIKRALRFRLAFFTPERLEHPIPHHPEAAQIVLGILYSHDMLHRPHLDVFEPVSPELLGDEVGIDEFWFSVGRHGQRVRHRCLERQRLEGRPHVRHPAQVIPVPHREGEYATRLQYSRNICPLAALAMNSAQDNSDPRLLETLIGIRSGASHTLQCGTRVRDQMHSEVHRDMREGQIRQI